MALKSSREGLRKELVDYLGNLIVDDNLRDEIIKVVGDNFVTSESLNETVNNLTMQITTESGERIEADDTLQNNITAEATAREGADTTLQNNINAETTARQNAISNLEELIRNGVLQMDLLWTNSSPTSAFESQIISLDLSQYKCVLIDIILGITEWSLATNTRQTICLVIGFDGKIGYGFYNDFFAFRHFKVNSDSIEVSLAEYNTANGNEKSRTAIIPYKIYGIK